MKVSKKGLDLIKHFEGFPNNGYPYRDPVGIWTIGYGTTKIDGKPVNANTKKLSVNQAIKLLKKQLDERYALAINNLNKAYNLKLNQNQFDALTSFVYNVGPGGVDASTGMGRALRRKDFKTASNEFLKWVNAGGRPLPGLVRRRQAERELFLEKTKKELSREVPKLATLKEKQQVKLLEAKRRIAVRNGGWDKVHAMHLQDATKAKNWLRQRLIDLKKKDLNKIQRRQRVKWIDKVIKNKY